MKNFNNEQLSLRLGGEKLQSHKRSIATAIFLLVAMWLPYAHGQGSDTDYRKANASFGQACNDGDMQACNSLAASYTFGTGVEVDFKKANALFQKACNGGLMQACSKRS